MEFYLRIIYGSLFCFAGIMHFAKPKFFYPFIPKPFPKVFSNLATGVIEVSLGLGLFFEATSKISSLGIFVLLFFLLFIHIWDYRKEKPAIGSKTIAIIRLPIQLLLMFGAYLIYINS